MRTHVSSSPKLSMLFWLSVVAIVITGLLISLPSTSTPAALLSKRQYKFGSLSTHKHTQHAHRKLPFLPWPQAARKVTGIPALATTPLTKLPKVCNGTMLNVVAHEDDDLLFINPVISRAIHGGTCIRTVFLTAGDDGQGSHYMRQREAGSRAAYAKMLGGASWSTDRFQAGSHAITSYQSGGSNQVSLLFMRLPDGNLDGSGFATANHESLAALHSGTISTISAIDGSGKYSAADLVDSLSAIIRYYEPTVINTQANDAGEMPSDHSDHIATGQFLSDAANKTALLADVHYYKGYPVRGLPPNLDPATAAEKSSYFLAYSAYDAQICPACTLDGVGYGSYASRLYEGHG